MATYKVGDIVKITSSSSIYHGFVGDIKEVWNDWNEKFYWIQVDRETRHSASDQSICLATDEEALRWRLTQ